MENIRKGFFFDISRDTKEHGTQLIAVVRTREHAENYLTDMVEGCGYLRYDKDEVVNPENTESLWFEASWDLTR